MTQLSVFVPGRLANPLNGSWGHWDKHRRLAKAWRELTQVVILAALNRRPVPWPAEKPKRVVFLVQTWNSLDDDALPGMCKPLRDGLRDMRLIHDDSPKGGHTFTYTQRINRKKRGVSITVEPEEPVT